jgi:hypothetical protein
MKSKEPVSYRAVIAMEYKKFQESLEEASATLLAKAHEEHLAIPELYRCEKAHDVIQGNIYFFYEDYILNGLGELLNLFPINEYHQMRSKGPHSRSPLDTYVASLRSMLSLIDSSYILKTVFSAFELDKVKARVIVAIHTALETLKNLEAVGQWVEKYLSWLEHGAGLQMAYSNANKGADEENVTLEDLFFESKTRAYAVLKTTDFSPQAFVAFIQDLDELLQNISTLVELPHRLYTSMDPDDFDNPFNAMVNKKAITGQKPKKFGLDNIKELNEFIRQRVKNSVERVDGFMQNAVELLDLARPMYIGKFVAEVLELLAFLPTEEEQRLFVKRYESGRLWRIDE